MQQIMRLATVMAIAMVVAVGLATWRADAAPAAPTYVGIERTIESIRQAWAKPGAKVPPNTVGWNALFDGLLGDLRLYSKADNDADRQKALDRIDKTSEALGTVSWAPAANLREELGQWLRPRVRLASARRQLNEAVKALPESTNPNIQANRSRWVDFVQKDVAQAIRDYDAADTVAQRQTALRKLYDAVASMRQRTNDQAWEPASEVSSAVDDLFNRPNLDVTADVATVSPVLEANLVESGPITRKGYTSMVTAGPKTGFGLLTRDDGISFFNSQKLTSVTPIWDFHQQLEQDPQGKRAAKMYIFSATTYDWSEISVTAIVRPSGLELIPSATHCIDAAIGSVPACGGEVARSIAAMIGFDQQKINQKVYEGALPKFQERIPTEAAEETQERIGEESEKRNADLKAKYLIGNDTVAINEFLITHLSLRSRPEAVNVGGLFQWRDAPGQRGADAPRPMRLATASDPGVTADVHLGSLLTSAASGFWRKFEVQFVKNAVIVTKAVPPGTPPRDAVTFRVNVDYPNYLTGVENALKAKDPRVTALRVFRPEQPPEFSTDARGFLVVLIRDFQLDVPAPDPQAGGNLLGVPAKVLRIKLPQAEVAISYQVDTSSPSLRLKGKIEEFNPGTNATILAINDDETKATPLTRFTSAFVMTALGTRIRNQNIDVDLDQLKLPGFVIRSVSPLDPSGWLRVNLSREAAAPARETQPARDVRPAPVNGPNAD
jgi:hypothetical protein